MATIKPRINVTLNNEVYEAIKEFSDIAGCSMSSVVADMLTANLETFRTTTMMLNMARAMEKDALAAIKPQVEELEGLASSQLTGAQEFMERFGGVLAGLQSHEGSSQHNPLAINKGVRSNKNSSHTLFLASSNPDRRGKK